MEKMDDTGLDHMRVYMTPAQLPRVPHVCKAQDLHDNNSIPRCNKTIHCYQENASGAKRLAVSELKKLVQISSHCEMACDEWGPALSPTNREPHPNRIIVYIAKRGTISALCIHPRNWLSTEA